MADEKNDDETPKVHDKRKIDPETGEPRTGKRDRKSVV
jgi:hypothetical protein